MFETTKEETHQILHEGLLDFVKRTKSNIEQKKKEYADIQKDPYGGKLGVVAKIGDDAYGSLKSGAKKVDDLVNKGVEYAAPRVVDWTQQKLVPAAKSGFQETKNAYNVVKAGIASKINGMKQKNAFNKGYRT